MSLRLSALLASAGMGASLEADPVIVDVTEDSREVGRGWLFVAIRGTETDGRRFARDAADRGAAAILSEEPLTAGVPVVVVPRVREVLADCAATLHGCPTDRLAVYGVTGTDGKSTTCYFLASMLEAAGFSTGIITTVETRAGGTVLDPIGRLTTPSAPVIQRTLARMVASGDSCAVVECSSHALSQHRLRNVHLRSAAITNIASDHIEYHGSHEAYSEAKARVAELVTPGAGPIFINRDDPASMALAGSFNRPVVTYGRSEDADLRASEVQTSLDSTSFVVHWRGDVMAAHLPTGGPFNVYNALAAMGMALSHGLSLGMAARGLSQARTPRGRADAIKMGQPFAVYVDYAHTEQAFESTLKFLGAAAAERDGRLIAVFGAAGDRDRNKRTRLAQIAARTCGYFVITDEDPFGEDPAAIIAEIAAGAPVDTAGRQWTTMLDRREAIELAIGRARPGDIVVITGKGHEASIVSRDRVIPWSDHDVARNILTAMGFGAEIVSSHP